MYTITVNVNHVVLTNDGENLLGFREDDRINLNDVTYVILRYGIGVCYDDSIAVPSCCYQTYYQDFKSRMKFIYFLTKLFEHYKVPYRTEYPSVCSFTNEKGQIYACYL